MDETRYAPPKAAVADSGRAVADVRAEVYRQAQSRRLAWAANACLVFATILFYRYGGARIRFGVHAFELLFVLAMAFGVYRRSRVCAVLVTLDYALYADGWSNGPMNPLFGLALAGVGCLLMLGTLAAFRYHRFVED